MESMPTVDELDLQIGTHLLKGELGVRKSSDQFKRRVGREWFLDHLSDFQDAVCGNAGIKGLFADSKARDRNVIIAAIADVVSKDFVGFPANLLAMRIVHYGIDTLCPTLRDHT